MKSSPLNYINGFISILLSLLLVMLSDVKGQLKDTNSILVNHAEEQNKYIVRTEKRLTTVENNVEHLTDIVLTKERSAVKSTN